LCFTIEWFRNGAPGKIFIMTQHDAIMLVYRARPPGGCGSVLPGSLANFVKLIPRTVRAWP
jgi:hypothetical protein